MSSEAIGIKRTGFLDARVILYTKPGRHEVPRELERQLVKKIGSARNYAQKIIVVYGSKFCYINADDPYRRGTLKKCVNRQAV